MGAGLYWLYGRIDEQVRSQVEQVLARHYAGMRVSIRSAALKDGEGIEVRGLSICERGAQGPSAELLYVDEMLLSCTTDLQKLITERPEVKRVTVRRSVLRATRRPDGSVSVSRLLPPPCFSDRPPNVFVENGTIEVFDPLSTPASTLVLRDVNLSICPGDPEGDTDLRVIEGSLTADHLRRAEFRGQVDPQRSVWTIGGSVEGIELSPELLASLPGPVASQIGVLGELRAQAGLTFQVAYDPAEPSPWEFQVAGRLLRGRIDDARLPHALTDIEARFQLDNAGLVIDDLRARNGQAALRLAFRQQGLAWGRDPFSLTANVRRMELDRALRDVLPAKLQDLWSRCRPAGLVDADAKLEFDGQKYHSDLTMRCLSVGFTHHRFPYRLEDGKGVVEVCDDRAELHLTAYSRSEPVRIDGEFTNLSADPVGWIEARSEEIPLDEKLLLALDDDARRVVRSLSPRGTIRCYTRLTRGSAAQPWEKYLLLGLNRCSVRYDKFPYPFSNVRGTIELAAGQWTFRDMEGTNDTARVTCHGRLTPRGPGRRLELHFVGTDVPLEEELRDALQPGIQRLWNGMKPQGRVDVAAEVTFLYDDRKLGVAVSAQPQSDTTSIEPKYFPYRMEKVRGLCKYRDGRLEVKQFRAEHDAVKIAADCQGEFRPDGTWRFAFERLSVDRLRLEDRQLAPALPEAIRRAVISLRPTGPVNLRGRVEVAGDGGPDSPLKFDWDMALGFHQGTIDAGLRLENLYGNVTLRGSAVGRQFRCQGELDLDSLSYKDYQLTEVRGPIFIDNARVGLGNWAERFRLEGSSREAPDPRLHPKPLTARLFDGTVYTDAWVALGKVPQYSIRASLVDAELSRCAHEVIQGRQDLTGKIYTDVELSGAGRSLNALVGMGRIKLREADVYELPMMVSLLKILSIREPNRTAFSKSDIEFVIRGGHLYFPQINFNGDAISLLGRGEMDFQKNVRLTFHALVGRDEVRVPLLRDLMGGASQQIMQIQVAGPLTNPEMRRVAFPGVNQALQQLQEDLQRGPQPRPNPGNEFPQIGSRPATAPH